jgi:hypothetical protein
MRYSTDVEQLLFFGYDPNEVRRFDLGPADLVLLFDTQVCWGDEALWSFVERWATGREAPADWLVSAVQLSRMAPPSQN